MRLLSLGTKIGLVCHFVVTATHGGVEEQPKRVSTDAQKKQSAMVTGNEEFGVHLDEAVMQHPLRELPGAEEALLLQVDELARTGEGRAALADEKLARAIASKAMAIGFLETVSAGLRLELPKLPPVCADTVTRIADIVSYLQTREQLFRVKRWSEKAFHGLRVFGKAVGSITPVAAAAKALGLTADKLHPSADRATLERLFVALEREVSVPLARFGAIIEMEMQNGPSETVKHYSEVLEKLKRVSLALDACMAFTLLQIYRTGKSRRIPEMVLRKDETAAFQTASHPEAENTEKEKRRVEEIAKNPKVAGAAAKAVGAGGEYKSSASDDDTKQ
ncbi:hypothetical protein TGMAS_268970 [Toxoplasma gondii MAS]|uniref:Transmembrane protein n=1 Tax=Toxoplasma gondii MAS TaxID=943118 RepID=A0A086QW42_TOXGO|nr:hypothetical protein TGMAS_268970 [Toxoplasma gondii MAS]